jgi:hypothetical protein
MAGFAAQNPGFLAATAQHAPRHPQHAPLNPPHHTPHHPPPTLHNLQLDPHPHPAYNPSRSAGRATATHITPHVSRLPPNLTKTAEVI